ncbi:MAG: MFS transporter [Dactylosporangium sp.]|nr:MFS transporter [Dactylosporangium sp.]NNJ60959.1 MFS transporter [Dactylosporangium sp.]
MPATPAPPAPSARGRRTGALVLAVVLTAVGTLFAGPVSPAAAAPSRAPGGPCSAAEWLNPANFQFCTGKLQSLGSDRASCVKAPTPGAPDSGMAGWFATRPDAFSQPGVKGRYTSYGYAGYDYTTYDIGGCVPTVMHPDYKFENTVANGLFLIATSVVGASNALRERAWNPSTMWEWADPLVEKATRAVYEKVFTVFGTVTLVIVGLYLLWRARQSDMSSTVTTAGWAVLVMVAVTAIAAWPTRSANAADTTLITSLNVVHGAVGPPSEEQTDSCPDPEPGACADNREPALRASDTAVDGMLYRNWLRGLLGSADSETAKKYGPVLYDAKAFTWSEIQDIRQDPNQRQPIIDVKADRWKRVAEQIKTEDPEAYEYLTGARGMERIGAGFIAILSAVFFALFDLTASVLVLLGFLIFRWAVIATPILGTFGLLRPASSGLRRLANIVIAAIFNIIIFGTGAAIYLFAVNLILGTSALPGWLQVVLILLTGVVGWMLLRPYRRITQLGGRSAADGSESWGQMLLRDLRASSVQRSTADAQAGPGGKQGRAFDPTQRPESRGEHVVVVGAPSARPPATGASAETTGPPASPRPEDAKPVSDPVKAPPRRAPHWEEPDLPASTPSYSIYRPDSDRPRTQRAPLRRPESANLPG